MAVGGHVFGCGQCMPCRINRRRVWTHRMMLEATQHPINSFWTLTYSDDNLPYTEANLPTLVPSHLRNFIKRLRKDYSPQLLRYFNVGEYGSQTERPHYHLALFNYPACDRGLSRPDRSGACCSTCSRVRRIWGYGQVYSGQLENASAAYVAGYVTKKLTSATDPILQGRHPEFARMSLQPGIGAGFVPEVASTLLSHNLEERLDDVPTSLQHGPTKQPLGRYLTRKLREHMGREPGAPQITLAAIQAEMRPLREAARQMAPLQGFSETFKALILDVNLGRYRQLEAKQKLYHKRDYL